MLNGYIDFRSDTVTQPTPAMREAMAKAEVGDDVFGDDPTINRLEELAAAKLGKAAAVFASGGISTRTFSTSAYTLPRGPMIIDWPPKVNVASVPMRLAATTKHVFSNARAIKYVRHS